MDFSRFQGAIWKIFIQEFQNRAYFLTYVIFQFSKFSLKLSTYRWDTLYKIVIFRPQKCIIPQKILRKIDIQSLNNVWGLFSYKKINKKNRITPWVKIFQGIFAKGARPLFSLREHSHMTSDVFGVFLTYLPTLIRYFTTYSNHSIKPTGCLS